MDPAYWAAVDPIRRSASADVLVFGLLMVVALSMAVFLYTMARKRDYAILRALGVPARQASGQLALPLLLLGGLGMLSGGLPAWNYALNQAKASSLHHSDASRGGSFGQPQPSRPGRLMWGHFPVPGGIFLAGSVYPGAQACL